ncbi:hypothetical protein BJX68DRAFT_224268 [Aspergillus pseudodeflectus]|uniref:Hsp70 family chaperone n=1 Tax=Aspergillus pseudodeflectus TaxID=176178 RepID=A0ABR4L9B9_9EURO
MSRRTNPPRRVRRKLTHATHSTTASSNNGERAGYGRSIPLRAEPNPPAARSRNSNQKLLVCLDYGTTFTSISYIVLDPDEPPVDIGLRSVRSVRDWPQAAGFFHPLTACVPSESWYRDGEYLWGYTVQQKLQTMSKEEDASSTNRIVRLAKLLLDEQEEASSSDPLREIKNALRTVGRTAREAVTDYLMHVFTHARRVLERSEGFTQSWEVELALCVPSKWSTYAHLTMQEIALEVTAATDMQGRNFSLFILDEPEAAVTFALRRDTLGDDRIFKEGSDFIVCDAGGGTVDVITYRVRQTDPFRFDEITTPTGKDCGSSYINQALARDSRRRLADVDLGSDTEYSKDAAIETDLLREFEYEVKRGYNPDTLEDGDCVKLRLLGLKADPSRNFGQGLLLVPKEQMNSYFERSITGTVSLIREHLRQVEAGGVKTLLLVGGFSRSPALRKRLQSEFTTLRIVEPEDEVPMENAVSRGGLLRALNKADGPRRKLRLNLGVCVTEEYNPRFWGHRASQPFYHPLNGKKYVKECIEWAIRKDHVLGEGTNASILMHRVFDVDAEMAAHETLYFSDQMVHPHYEKDHWRNSGHREAGVVEASLDFLRENRLIQPKINDKGKEYYVVDYSLELEVNGRNMKALIRYPPGQEVQGENQICIAAAFRPGTK